jgi:hypothetical protein
MIPTNGRFVFYELEQRGRARTVAELTVLVIDLGWLLVGLGLCGDCRQREVTL